jgi:hypothetical protein
VPARIDREPRQQRRGTVERRGCAVFTVHLDPEPSDRAYSEHFGKGKPVTDD